jgi:hypothetical protein
MGDPKKTYEEIKDRPEGDLNYTEEEIDIIAEQARADLAKVKR